MTHEMKNISICVCSYRRPNLLKRLLEELGSQETGGLFTYSIVVIDNDQLESAKPVVTDFSAASSIPIEYHVEPRQNIALARNKAVEHASGDFVAFIDDDEFPIKRWLLTLFEACQKYGVDGALGPVKPHFDQKPPEWVIKCGLFERPTYATGFVINWRKGRTGNVLLKRHLFSTDAPPFRPEFRTGEDQDFFRRMIEKGYVFIWCNEAVAFEVVPPIRWNRKFMLKKALLRGTNSTDHPTFGVRDLAKSIIAVPTYACALPFALMLGRHRFMALLVKLFDHLGAVLGALGMNPIKEPYITD